MSKINKIIAFTGARGVGKSTLANHLISKSDHKFAIESFASPMKRMLNAMGVSEYNLYDPKGKQEEVEWLGKTTRYLMQTLGTAWGRELVDGQIWLKALKQRVISEYSGTDTIVIIDDLRFDNEAEFILENGGSIYSLHRDGVDYTYEHSTEKPLNDSILFNAHTLKVDDLDKAVEEIELQLK